MRFTVTLFTIAFAAACVPVARAQSLPLALAKSAERCQRAIDKAGATAATKRLRSLAICHTAAFKCLQANTSVADCLPKARARCTAELVKIATAERSQRPALARRCAFDAAGMNALVAPSGLGFDAAQAACAEAGTSLTSVAALVECVYRRSACALDAVFDAQAPRARELLRVLGLPALPLDTVACLPDHGGDGVSAGDAVGVGRLVARCGAAITNAATTFAIRELRASTQCIERVFACVQLRPGESDCLTGA